MQDQLETTPTQEPQAVENPPQERPAEPAAKKEIILTAEQQAAVDLVCEWIHDKKGSQTKTLGGYAGTGKTECIRRILNLVNQHPKAEEPKIPGICAFTGKAVAVLRNKGIYSAMTLHSTIYQPEYEGKQLIGFKLMDHIIPDFIIVDEASMINAVMDTDLRKFKKKILYVGDMGQLEPIGDDPYLMANPDIRLTSIHRQAIESPIIAFSKVLREGLEFDYGKLGGLEITHVGNFEKYIYDCDQVICGFNKTRHEVNRLIRQKRGYTEQLEVGDRLICLKNNFKMGVYNGLIATVASVSTSKFSPSVFICNLIDELGNELEEVRIYKKQLGADKLSIFPDIERCTFWDYGYCITAHKSQGSEWKRVVVKEEIVSSWDPRRWAYTAATRAADELVYCR